MSLSPFKSFSPCQFLQLRPNSSFTNMLRGCFGHRPVNNRDAERGGAHNMKVQSNRTPYVLIIAEALDQVIGTIYDVAFSEQQTRARIYI